MVLRFLWWAQAELSSFSFSGVFPGCRPGHCTEYLRALNLPALFSGASKFDITKPTNNINLASTNLCLVTTVTGGLSFVRPEDDMSRNRD